MTKRSTIRLWWSTTPALVGYPQYPDHAEKALRKLIAGRPDFVGTVRQVSNEMDAVRRRVSGCFVSFFLYDRHGCTFTLREFRQLLG